MSSLDTAAPSCSVRVCVRVRPSSSPPTVVCHPALSSITVNPKDSSANSTANTTAVSSAFTHQFTYDNVFDQNVHQNAVYSSCCHGMLDSILDGYNATILAYGQTGSGKTYTMGSESQGDRRNEGDEGIIPRFMNDLFDRVNQKTSKIETYSVAATFLEVYGEDIHDLLAVPKPSREGAGLSILSTISSSLPNKDGGASVVAFPSLPIREDPSGVSVIGISSVSINSCKEGLEVLKKGTMHRTTAATLMNKHSSRSHAVFTVLVTKSVKFDHEGKDGDGNDLPPPPPTSNIPANHSTTSKLTFVDLAGSERMKKTGAGADGNLMKEGIQINVGLLALGNVINALGKEGKEGGEYVPYRQSKLTRLLQDALGGNSRTTFLACVSPDGFNVSETLSTLKYANRARNIKNKPIKNVDPTVTEIAKLNAVREVLRAELCKVKYSFEPGDIENNIKLDYVQKYLKDVEGIALKKFEGESSISVYSGYKSVYSSAYAYNTTGIPTNNAFIGQTMPSSSFTSIAPELDEALINSSPDEDLAILDKLLDLQQGEAEYAKSQAEGSEELEKIEGELKENEKLFDKLRGNLVVYHDMKGKYERLIDEVNSLESEKISLEEQLKKVEADPSRGCSASIKTKMAQIEANLSRARAESRKQQLLCKKAEEEAAKAKAMQKKVEDLKKGKVMLIKKQEDVIKRHREFTERKTKEIEALKRKERKVGKEKSKLELECNKHQRTLDRRTVYCHKIASKLKQTEAHLMRLLAMRKRELEKSNVGKVNVGRDVAPRMQSKLSRNRNKNKTLARMSFIQPPSWSSADSSEETTFAPHNQEIASLKFLVENYLGDRLELVETREKYEQAVEDYSDLMRQMVEEVNKLSQIKEECSEDEENEQLLNAERVIEDLELRLELTGSDMEELRSRLGSQLDLDKDAAPMNSNNTIQDENILKMIGDLTAPVARTLIIDLMESLTSTEMQARGVEKEFAKKDAAIERLEMENRDLKNKLANFAEMQTSYGGNPDAPLIMKKDLTDATKRLSETREQLTAAEAKYQSTGIELAECKEKLCVVDLSKEVKKEAVNTLAQLQAYWRLLGVDLEDREKLRVELETCVEEKCNALLRDASRMEQETRKEIEKLTKVNVQMERLMGVMGGGDESESGSKVNLSRLSLLKQMSAAKEKYEEMQPKFVLAQERKKRIHSDAKDLFSALEKSEQECSQKLRDFLASAADAEGVFEESLLKHCEGELRTMRVKKSELLVQSNVAYDRANALAKETHTSCEDIFKLCKKLMERKRKAGGRKKEEDCSWWTEDVCQQVCNFVSTPNMKVTTDALHQKHLLVVAEAIEQISQARREFGVILKCVVEEAHKQLMSVVEGEDDATEAYASFHEALFRLPRLSKDHIVACVDELTSLVEASDIMMQSETEALTVVWDALEVKSGSRGIFWGECEDNVKNYEKQNEKNFAEFFGKVEGIVRESQSKGESEDWLVDCLAEAKLANKKLSVKLFKLRYIHSEVERKRTKQDTKSKIVRLDSEIRIIDAKLAQFEEKASNKQRLVSKKANSGVLLKEEKFRKHMQAKFISKLDSLRETLKDWNARERKAFDVSILSQEVRELLSEGSDERTQFMHLRTVASGATSRRKSVVGAADDEAVRSSAARVETVAEEDDDEDEEQEERAEAREREVSKESVMAALAAATAATEEVVAAAAQPRKTRTRAASLAAYKVSKKEMKENTLTVNTSIANSKVDGAKPAKKKEGTESNRRITIAVSTPTKQKDFKKKNAGISVFGNLLQDTPTKDKN